ncbi:MAG: proteasome assembly chaperone family protein [Candidatus Hadarchaeia archaeon]
MTESRYEFVEEPDLEDPVLIEGLPGIGYVGKLAADHIIDELEAEEFALMTSPYFPHHVTVDSNGILDLAKIRFYRAGVNDRDLVIVGGDVQATSSEGHYEVTEKLLDIVENLGIESLYSLGGYATGKHTDSEPTVVGAANDEGLLEKYKELGIEIEEGTGPILGVSGLLLGLGVKRGIEGTAFLGETHGMLVDHRSAQKVLETLANVLGFDIDMEELKKRAEKTEQIINRLQKEQKIRNIGGPGKDEDLSYIG